MRSLPGRRLIHVTVTKEFPKTEWVEEEVAEREGEEVRSTWLKRSTWLEWPEPESRIILFWYRQSEAECNFELGTSQ